VSHEKNFTQSKKFVFAFFGVLVLAILGIVGFFTQTAGAALTPVFLAVVITIGFIVVGVVLGQTVLDKYVRVAEITAQKFVDEEEENDTEDPE